MCALARYPSLWAAGSAIVPFLNWFTEIQNERDDLRLLGYAEHGRPGEDKDRLREASRSSSSPDTSAGPDDRRRSRSPLPTLGDFASAGRVKETGNRRTLSSYPDEGHGFLKMDNRVDASPKERTLLDDV